LDSPFEEPSGKDQLLDDLLLERHPYTVSQANSISSGDYEADKTYVKLATLKTVALLALRNVYKVASHAFLVCLWDLFPGTRDNESHVFTRVRQRRNQYLVQAKQAETNGLQLRPHSANDDLGQVEAHHFS
jgi:hypothetical protein